MHSSYSLGVGLATPEELCAHAARLGFARLALTDTSSTFGFLEFHKSCIRHGLSPIYGAVIRHAPAGREGEGRFTLTVLATDAAGLRNVAALASLSEASNEHGGGVPLERLGARAGGVVALCGTPSSEVATELLTGDPAGARRAVEGLKAVFGERLFLEIQDHGDPEERQLASILLELAAASGCPPVLTQEVRYTGDNMHELYGLLSVIQHSHESGDFFKMEAHLPNRSMRSPHELEHLAQSYPEAWANASVISDLVTGDLLAGVDGNGQMPLIDAEADKHTLHDLCTRRFYRKYPNLTNTEITDYQTLIKREVDDIAEAGLVPTFLFAHEVLTRIRDGGVGLGPATGLSLQSLCAYLLDITTYDPYRTTPGYQPMLDPRTSSVEEIELQITSEGRAATLERLKELLGPESLAYAPGVERITPQKAVKMMARAMEANDEDVQKVLHIIARHPGRSLRDMMGADRQLGRVYRELPGIGELLTRATHIENLPSGFVRSRRTLAVSSDPLGDFFGVTTDTKSGDVFVQAPREALPAGQILRIDFTPLGAVSILSRASAMLQKEKQDLPDWNDLPLEDSREWEEVGSADTTGIFLFEGETVREHRAAFRLRSIVDLTNYLALMRLRGDRRSIADRIADFNDAENVILEQAGLATVLGDTNGHLIYDEQLRDIVQTLTGYDGAASLRILNDLRDGTPGALSRARHEFMTGAADHDVPMEVADRWFDRLLHRAPDTIHRERVLADALLVFLSFHARSRYNDVFFVSVLNTYWRNEAKLRKYLAYLREHDRILDLDINKSRVRFTLERGKIRVGLCGVWGLRRDTIGAIAKERQRKDFRTLEEFVVRMKGVVEKDELRHLVMAGAFDFEGAPRKDLARAATRLLGRPSRADKLKKSGQMELPF